MVDFRGGLGEPAFVLGDQPERSPRSAQGRRAGDLLLERERSLLTRARVLEVAEPIRREPDSREGLALERSVSTRACPCGGGAEARAGTVVLLVGQQRFGGGEQRVRWLPGGIRRLFGGSARRAREQQRRAVPSDAHQRAILR